MQPGDEDDMLEWWRDPRQVPLSGILRAPKDKVSYVYDMGDHWEHLLVVEKTTPLPPGAPLPPVLVFHEQTVASGYRDEALKLPSVKGFGY